MSPVSRETLKLSEANPEFAKQLIALGAPDITACFQCGGCQGECPAGEWTQFNIRRIMDKAILGLERQLVDDPTIWNCVTCYRCKERCPQKAGPSDVVLAIRRFKASRRELPAASINNVRNIMSMGSSVPLEKVHCEQRERLGLQAIPENKKNKQKVVGDLRRLMAAISESRGVDESNLMGGSTLDGIRTQEVV